MQFIVSRNEVHSLKKKKNSTLDPRIQYDFLKNEILGQKMHWCLLLYIPVTKIETCGKFSINSSKSCEFSHSAKIPPDAWRHTSLLYVPSAYIRKNQNAASSVPKQNTPGRSVPVMEYFILHKSGIQVGSCHGVVCSPETECTMKIKNRCSRPRLNRECASMH
jgi:hypothetical protein